MDDARVVVLELVDPQTLTPLDRLDGEVLALLAARIGTTRLIDNELIKPPVTVPAAADAPAPADAPAGATGAVNVPAISAGRSENGRT